MVDFSDLGGVEETEDAKKKDLPSGLDFSDLGGSAIVDSVSSASLTENPSQYIKEIAQDLPLSAIHDFTLGGADEIEGALKAAATTASANPFDEDFQKKFRQYQELAEAKYKLARERSPKAAIVGGLLGGVAAAPLMGGAGLIGSATRVATKEALKQGGKMAAAKVLGQAALKDAALAAPASAVYGSLSSDADLIGASPEEIQENLKEAGSMGVLGGTLAGTIGLASNLAPVALESAKKAFTPKDPGVTSRMVKLAYDKGKQGVNLSDEAVQGKLFRAPGEFADELMTTLEKADDFFGQSVGKTIDDANAAGILVNVDDSLINAATELQDAFIKNPSIATDKRAADLMQKMLSGNSKLTPDEARTLKDEMNKALKRMKGDNSTIANTTREITTNFRDAIDQSLKDAVPAYREAARNFARFRQNTSEQFLAGHTPASVKGVQFGSLKDGDYKLRQKIEDLVQGATKPGAKGVGEDKAAWSLVQERLKELERTNPEAFQKMGDTAGGMINKIKAAADESAMIQGYTQIDPRTSLPKGPADLLTSAGGSFNAKMLNMANKAGRFGVLDKASSVTTFVPRMTKKALFDLPLEGLQVIANQLTSTGSTQAKKYGEALSRAIANKDQVSKNATLFAILQNPTLRQTLDLEEENK